MFIGHNSPVWRYGQTAVLAWQCDDGWMGETTIDDMTGQWWLNNGEFVKITQTPA